MKELKNRLAAFSNTTLGSALAIAFFFVMFILLQIPSTFALGGAINSVTPEGIKKFVIAYALCSVLTIYLFARFRWAPVSRDYIRTKPWAVMVWIVFLGIGSIVPSMVLQEMFEFDMPEQLGKLMTDMMRTPLGYAAIGILAPVAEEMVFRGAILRKLLAVVGEKWHWPAILFSAVLFGVAHGNIAQFVHAFLMGILLGWMYYRSRSVVPGIALHWVNNTIAYVIVNILPEGMEDMTLKQLAGGSTTHMVLYLAFSVFIFVPALLQVVGSLKRTPNDLNV